MSISPASSPVRTAAAQTAGTAQEEATRTAGTAREEAARTAQTAQQELTHVASRAQSAVGDVVGTTREQVATVAADARDQVRDLTDQVRGQLSEQAGRGAAQAAQAVQVVAEELRQMAAHSNAHGAASQAAHALSERAEMVAGYLQGRDPVVLVSDLRGAAARRPGSFLLGAALAGVLTGRLVKGTTAAAGHPGTRPAAVIPPVPAAALSRGWTPTPAATGPTSAAPGAYPPRHAAVSSPTVPGSDERPSFGALTERPAAEGPIRWLS